MRGISGPAGRKAGIIIGALIALKITILFLTAWNRRFIMDEFAQLGWARYLGHELFDTIWPSKTVGFTVFIKLAHLIGWDAQSILLAGRMQTALLACATLTIVFACARTLGHSRVRSALILLILLSFSNFIERIFETRAEPLAVFFGAAALLAAVRGEVNPWRVLACGVLSGLAFLATQKAIYFNFALGVALVSDAAFTRRYAEGLQRGTWLVFGWLLPVAAYCVVFGGSEPLAVARNLYFGPLRVASFDTAAAYGGLRGYVAQTLVQNTLLYAFCFGGMILATMRFGALDSRTRTALVYTSMVTVLVFSHNQPWPYVFVMALPFMSLWALRPFDALEGRSRYRVAAFGLLALGIATSFARNAAALQIDNRDQLALVARAERLTSPKDVYFDGIGMLPNRPEPSTVWLDRSTILQTIQGGEDSEVYRSFLSNPPKVILWSYRLAAIRSLIAPLVRQSYVRIAPNTSIAGRRLAAGQPVVFVVPVEDAYALYSPSGQAVAGRLQIDGQSLPSPINLSRGAKSIRLLGRPRTALLLPQGSYSGRMDTGQDNNELFGGIYD
jgi:hypothetical protein